jgi:hypothetical protein
MPGKGDVAICVSFQNSGRVFIVDAGIDDTIAQIKEKIELKIGIRRASFSLFQAGAELGLECTPFHDCGAAAGAELKLSLRVKSVCLTTQLQIPFFIYLFFTTPPPSSENSPRSHIRCPVFFLARAHSSSTDATRQGRIFRVQPQ